MVWNPWENLPQAVFFDPKAKALFQDFCALLENDYLEPITNPLDVRGVATEGQSDLTHNQ